MKYKISAIFMLIMFCETTLADDKYQFCSISGYFYGAGEAFIGSLADTLKIRDKELINNRTCTAIYQQALRVGEKMGRHGTLDVGDWDIVMPALKFKERIENSILKSAGY